MNDYKQECFKRLEYTQKYSKYSEEDLVEEIIEKDKEIERQSKMLINRDKEFLKLNDEIERLNNIIDELEKYLETEKDNHSNSWHYREWIRQVFDKLKELKEGK